MHAADSGARRSPWIERIGLEPIRARVLDDPEGRAELAKRFRYSQTFTQDDPWAKRVAGEEHKLHHHLAEIRPFEMIS